MIFCLEYFVKYFTILFTWPYNKTSAFGKLTFKHSEVYKVSDMLPCYDHFIHSAWYNIKNGWIDAKNL
jgi:hypothetical protein